MICLPSYLAHFLFIQLPCGMTALGCSESSWFACLLI